MTAFQKGCIDPALSAVTAALPILGAETAVSHTSMTPQPVYETGPPCRYLRDAVGDRGGMARPMVIDDARWVDPGWFATGLKLGSPPILK